MRLYLYISILLLIVGTRATKAQVSLEKSKCILKELLKKDYNELSKQINSRFFKKISLKTFTSLFYEGIHQSIPFIESFRQPEQINLYQKRIRKILRSRRVAAINQHKIMPLRIDKKSCKAMLNWSGSGHQVFSAFSGRWFGHWESNRVEHYWLPPRNVSGLPHSFPFGVSIQAYQSAFTGDGFGWNYQIHRNGKSSIIGYVCHFDAHGNIYMKRPHIGVPQSDNSIIWMTNDHVYYEFICRNEKHQNLSTHYVISGAYFQKGKKILKVFQEIYVNGFPFAPNLQAESHQ